MREPTVEQVMQEPVYTVNADDPVQTAVERMRELGTKKILVLKNGKPTGVLEAWMITTRDYTRKIGDMELRPFGKAPVGASLSKVKGDISSYTAVYIYDPKNPEEFVGVVTSYDFVRAL